LPLTRTTTRFKHLRNLNVLSGPAETGHAAYDRVLRAAIDSPGRSFGSDVESIRKNLPVAELEREAGESLGRAMLINTYVFTWHWWWSQGDYNFHDKMRKMREAVAIFTQTLDHARVSAEDAEALLAEHPESMRQDSFALFTDLIIRSFPGAIPSSLLVALNAFLDRFFEYDIRKKDDNVAVIGGAIAATENHLRLMRHIGRDPMELKFYRDRAEIFDWSRRHHKEMRESLGPLHQEFWPVEEGHPSALPKEAQAQISARLEGASALERGRFAADECRLALPSPFSEAAKAWKDLANLPFHLRYYTAVNLRELLKRNVAFTPDQACVVLEYLATEGQKHSDYFPYLTVPLAKVLAKSLPVGRPDLQEKVEKTWRADPPAKKIVLDALRGVSTRGLQADDKLSVTMKAIAKRRETLLEQIRTQPVHGAADPASASVPDWGEIRGQFIRVDVIGYAKQIALAQSAGTDISACVADIQAIKSVAEKNLAYLETCGGPYHNLYQPKFSAAVLEAAKAGDEAAVLALATREERRALDYLAFGWGDEVFSDTATMFGSRYKPALHAIIKQERATIAALESLLARMAFLQANPDLLAFERDFVTSATGSKPTEKLIRACKGGKLPSGLIERISRFDHELLTGPYSKETESPFPDFEFAALRTAIWALHGLPAAQAAPVLRDLAAKSFCSAGGIHDEKVGNAALWALEAMPDGGGVSTLAQILARARHPKVRKRINDALDRAAAAAGMTRQTLDEISVADHQMANGELRLPIGPGAAVLRLVDDRIDLQWEDAAGTLRKSPSKALKDAEGSGIADAKAQAAEIARDLATQSLRLQALYLQDVCWDVPIWRERYADHGTMAMLARRLLWRAVWADRSAVIMPTASGACDVLGQPVDLTGAKLHLWHPLMSDSAAVEAWRDRLIALNIHQPFRQVWRETYVPTDAERATRSYSNRFAGHIIRQHQMMTLAHQNGWTCTHRMWVDAPNDEPSHLLVPAYGLQVEFWTEGAGGDDPPVLDSGAYVYLGTDRLKFHRLDSEARFGRGASIDLTDVPPIVFSEIMRHGDFFTSVASICMDPEWMDKGDQAQHPNQWRRDVANTYWQNGLNSDLTPSGEVRRAALLRILPKLRNGDAFVLEKNHLRVRGQKHDYMIHLGSSAVIIADSRRHVCIVPAGQNRAAVMLPFTGDVTLSNILSKAMLLANDAKITDPVILRQI